ncbi:G2/M phase-specific E3 ubiquitin-protein ligase-like [Labrus mixtus]|uniref:G2/M phase-specific E3 ubiquitin-protein ligase-like n=1 Tax=Labrus mixtus TaxID=508554 RepID=UPI0029BFA99C|nr:G2/M phase-specific E3 ubiquitin-protein ligase-like [Labrus mixtus]
MTARITIDCGWSANQMESRLLLLFRGRIVRQTGQKFSFTYLQCVQGSRVLFVPDTPAEGWTVEEVLKLAGHGALYMLSHQEYPQRVQDSVANETSVLNKTGDFSPEEREMTCLDKESQLSEQTQPHVCGPSEEVDLKTILTLFRQDNVDQNVETHIEVRRGDLLHCALREVRRPGFSFRTTPTISFVGEETHSHEGALGEFFRLTLLELQQTSLFEGLPGRLFFTYDLSALEDRKYYDAGVLVGWSLTQGGPGPDCLHPSLYQLMCGQNPSLEDFSWKDIVDVEAQNRLQQLQSCRDVNVLIPSLCDWLSSCGIPEIQSAHTDEVTDIYSRVVKHYIYHRVSSMISQFTEGLNSCSGLWDMIQSRWEVFKPVMTGAHQHPLTLEEFKQLFTVCYSPPDSPLRAAEEAAAAHWETALALISDRQADFSLEELLFFITGAEHQPPLGSPKLISLRFYPEEGSMSGVHRPHTSTCALELLLPTGVAGAADVLLLLGRAMLKALGFTCVQEEEEGEGENSSTDVMTDL